MDLFGWIVGENFQRVQFLAVTLPRLIDLHENPPRIQRSRRDQSTLYSGPVGVSFAVPDNTQSPIHTSHFLSSGGGVALGDCP
jgi:hypothetical protein